MDIVKPDEIEKKSMELVDEKLGELDLDPGEREIVRRVVHATADPSLAEKVIFSEGAIENGLGAMRAGSRIICDVEMVRAGLRRERLSELDLHTHCFVHEPEVRTRAEKEGVTRSIAAMRVAAELNEELIFVIGNAPTALEELLRLFREETMHCGLVIGTPVGFVGAAESKAKLTRSSCPHITLRGRRGGTPVAVAITNALLGMVRDGG